MLLEELYTALQTLGLPVVYQTFRNPQSPGYIAYFEDSQEPVTADGLVVAERVHVEIHILTGKRDRTFERQAETLLDRLGLVWERFLDWDEKQVIFDTAYAVELVNGREFGDE